MNDTTLTQPRSGSVQFEIVSYRGEVYGPYKSAGDAVRAAKEKWPHQSQDEDRTGKGWDIQVAGLA